MSRSGSLITLGDFRKLLNKKEFLDFFNKFASLPAFSQLVVYSRKRRQFILHPPLPHCHTLNYNGLIEWLWKKRMNLFLWSPFYGEYRLCSKLIRHSLIDDRGTALKTEISGTVRRSLRWLQRKCLGRVAGIRKFRRFLRNTCDGSKLYEYWVDSERLVLFTKRRSLGSTEVLTPFKEKYLLGSGEFKLSQHLLDQAWENLSRTHRGYGIVTDAKSCGFTFVFSLQKICFDRMKNYWMPRFLLEQNPHVSSEKEAKCLDLAKNYLRGTISLIPVQTSSGLLDSEQREKHDSEKEEYGNEDFSEDEEIYIPDLEKKSNQEIATDKTLVKTKRDNERRKRISFQDHPSPGLSHSEEEKGAGSSTESSSENEEGEYDHRMEKRKDGYRLEQVDRIPGPINIDDPLGEQASDEKDKQSAAQSYSAESFEDDHEKDRDGRQEERRFRLENKRRRKKIHTRKMKFEELLTKESFRRPDLSSDQAKLFAKGKVNVDRQKVLFGSDDSQAKLSQRHSNTKTDVTASKLQGKKVKTVKLKVTKTPIGHRNSSRLSSQFNAHLRHMTKRRSKILSPGDLLKRVSFPRKSIASASPSITQQTQSNNTDQLDANRRKSALKKGKKKKATTLTFSLCVEKPEKNLAPILNRRRTWHLQKSKKSHKIRFTTPTLFVSPVLGSSRVYTIDKDNAYRTEPENARMILALQADQCASQTFRNFLITSDDSELVFELQFWQEVEKSRHDFEFGMMSFASFTQSMRNIATQYLMDSSPCRIQASDILRKEAIMHCLSPEMKNMPWQIRNLQKHAMEELKYAHKSFRQQERQSFLVATAVKEYDRAANRGVCLPSITNESPIYEVTSKVSDELQIEMNSRRARSLRYIIETTMPEGRYASPMLEISDESDDDGCVPAPPIRTNIRSPPIDYKELASRSVKQYPVLNNTRIVKVTVKFPTDRRKTATPYLLKKGGLIRRPQTRPTSFSDLMKDPVHFQFFKKYLQAHHADVPLNFWNAIEGLRSINRIKSKQIRARYIIKKYFHDPKITATKLLQCNADIIKEIPYVDIVTPPMLYTAQQVVGRLLDDMWFNRYADTYEQPSESTFDDVEKCENAPVARMHLSRNKRLRKVWPILAEFIRRAISFLRSMKKPRMFALFEKFLQDEARKNQRARQNMRTFPHDNFADNDASSVIGFHGKKRDAALRKMSRGVVNGQIITYDLLPNDLRFWRDILCYKNVLRGYTVENCGSFSCDERSRVPRRKAHLIVSCYLNSRIAPNVRVNVPLEVAEITVDSFQAGMVDQALFHEATVYVFPLLLHFWKKFCAEHYRYVPTISKKVKLIYGLKLTPAIAEQMRNKRLGISDIPEGGDSKACNSENKKSERINPAVLPNHLRMPERKFMHRGSSALAEEDMGCRMTFSVRTGVTLINSSLRRRTLVLPAIENLPFPQGPTRLGLLQGISVLQQAGGQNNYLQAALRKGHMVTQNNSVR